MHRNDRRFYTAAGSQQAGEKKVAYKGKLMLQADTFTGGGVRTCFQGIVSNTEDKGGQKYLYFN